MAFLKPQMLRQQAEEALEGAAYSPKKLVLFHTAVSLGVALLITVLNFFLSRQIEGTGGLAGLGVRSMLSTAQSVLEVASMVTMPFWEAGLVYAMLCWIKGEKAEPDSLLQGFRRLGQVLLLQLIRGMLFISLGISVLYLCLIIFLVTSMSSPLEAMMEPMLEQGMSQQQMVEMMQSADYVFASAEAVLPFVWLFVGLFAVVALPFFYRLRFADFSVMDGTGPIAAMIHSLRMTKKNCLQLVKLDLSFWWYYALQVICMVLCYGDLLLPMLDVTIPFSADTAFFLFFLLGTASQGLLFWQYRGSVLTTYGMAYRQLWQKPPTAREQNLPYR